MNPFESIIVRQVIFHLVAWDWEDTLECYVEKGLFIWNMDYCQGWAPWVMAIYSASITHIALFKYDYLQERIFIVSIVL